LCAVSIPASSPSSEHRGEARARDAGTADASIRSVDRAITVLEILARRGDTRVTEVAAELGVHKSTAFRLLTVLEDRGVVEQDRDRGRYRLGLGLVRLASAVTGRMDLHRGRPVCVRLASELGETVTIAVRQGSRAVNIEHVPGATPVASQQAAALTPLHATSSGKVLLAALAPAERERVMAAGLESFTEATVVDPLRLELELDRVRRSGYATASEEYERGLSEVAAPIRGAGGDVVAAVSASGPAVRLTPERLAQLAPVLIAGADEIGHFLVRPGPGR